MAAVSRIRPVAAAKAVTEATLSRWFAVAPAGARIAYHRGLLAVAIAPETSDLPEADRCELQRVADRARSLANAGLAHLLQRRNGEFDFSYLIEVRPRPRTLTAAQRAVLLPPAVPSAAA